MPTPEQWGQNDEVWGEGDPVIDSPRTIDYGPEGFVGKFIRRAASNLNPLPLAELAVEGRFNPLRIGGMLAEGIGGALGEQMKKAQAAESPTEKFLRTVAGRVPVLGPAAADVAEHVQAGEFAEPIADIATAFLPVERVAGVAGKLAGKTKKILRERAAEQTVRYMNPKQQEILQLKKLVKESPGVTKRLGHGNIETLRKRAEKALAPHEAMQSDLKKLTVATDLEPVETALEKGATRYETTTLVPKEVESKILGPSGEPITTIVEEPVTTSAYPAHGKAMREQAAHVKALREQFGEEVPAGELFRQREAAGRAGMAAEGLAAGAKAAPAAEAGRQARKAYSAAGHEQIPGAPR